MARSLNSVYKTNTECFLFELWLNYKPSVISKSVLCFGAQYGFEITLSTAEQVTTK